MLNYDLAQFFLFSLHCVSFDSNVKFSFILALGSTTGVSQILRYISEQLLDQSIINRGQSCEGSKIMFGLQGFSVYQPPAEGDVNCEFPQLFASLPSEKVPGLKPIGRLSEDKQTSCFHSSRL